MRRGLFLVGLWAIFPAAVGQAQEKASVVLESERQPQTQSHAVTQNQGLTQNLATPLGQHIACPDCNPPKRFWAGAWELMAVQFVPWAYTKWVTEGEWSNISLRTWEDNSKFLG